MSDAGKWTICISLHSLLESSAGLVESNHYAFLNGNNNLKPSKNRYVFLRIATLSYFLKNALNEIVKTHLITVSCLYVIGHHRHYPKGTTMKRMFSLIKNDKQLINEMYR